MILSNRFIWSAVFAGLALISACSKGKSDPVVLPPAHQYKLSYGDSIFYVRDSPADYIIKPIDTGTGQYIVFPEGLELEADNGAIDISKSETGLRYRVSFIPAGTTDTISTYIVISGVNYYDKIYDLSANDSIAAPVYNASLSRPLPGESEFDGNDSCRSQGILVDSVSGDINLAASVRAGAFGASPVNGSMKDVLLQYKINDPSYRAQNKMRVRVYYFNTSADIPSDLVQQEKDREGTILGAFPGNNWGSLFGSEVLAGANGTTGINGKAKPRPPCIFIVGRL